jgi:hypothetical protein
LVIGIGEVGQQEPIQGQALTDLGLRIGGPGTGEALLELAGLYFPRQWFGLADEALEGGKCRCFSG